MRRWAAIATLLPLFAADAVAQKPRLADAVLSAKTVFLVAEISGERPPASDELVAKCAEFLKKWGRLTVVTEPGDADLVFLLRYSEEYGGDDRSTSLVYSKPVVRPKVRLTVHQGRNPEWFDTPVLWQEKGGSNYHWSGAHDAVLKTFRKAVERAEREAARPN